MAIFPLKRARTSTQSDWLGVCASILCAIHCAAMPFVISYLPALGLSFLADELFHKVMVFVCFSIATYAFVPQLMKHRNWRPITFGIFGLVFISAGAFSTEDNCCATDSKASPVSPTETAAASCCETDCDETQAKKSTTTIASTARPSQLTSSDEQNPLSSLLIWATPLGGLLLVTGHLLNRKYGCSCNCCPQPDEQSIASATGTASRQELTTTATP